MQKTPYLIEFNEKTKEKIANYHDYGYVVHLIKTLLHDKYGFPFHMYADDETSNEIWEVLEEDLELYPESVEVVSHLFDGLETRTISSNHTVKQLDFIIKPRIANTLYYYPGFQVALARSPIFLSHSETQHDFILAKNNECLVAFLNYILKRKREYTKNYVTVFTDTENGIDSSKEKITTFVTREDVFLEESLKKEIYRSIDEFFTDSGSFFQTYNIPYKRGILLYGKPGNGKTTLVKSIANSITAPVAYWQITEHTSSYSVHEVFSTVNRMTPMVLVIEDIDSMPLDVRSVFLNTLDGATSKDGIFLIGTTNYPEKIDPALINRSGRFDRAYEIKLPTNELRLAYLKKKKMSQFISSEELERIVELTDAFSYAQLNELYTSVALQWHYEKEVQIDQICAELQADNKKKKKQTWDSETDTHPVGFVRY
ncbi:ATP-binding protein [Sutcliffiella halmapala]|uniref:ATP-binding protein n=1 Tax=Sutcliffiella halmapala TaxID=79882 RepID=UPI000994A09D|nr:AAA family ATPase [Sutcliffiella halmapala]